MRSRYTILLAIAAVLVGALVYTGCGGDDDSTSSNSSSNTDSQAAKIRAAKTMVKTNRRRGRG